MLGYTWSFPLTLLLVKASSTSKGDRNSSCGQFNYSWVCSNVFCRNPPALHIRAAFTLCPSLFSNSICPQLFAAQHISPRSSPLYFRGIFGFPTRTEIAFALLNQKILTSVCETGFAVRSGVALWKLLKLWKSEGQQRVHLQERGAEI